VIRQLLIVLVLLLGLSGPASAQRRGSGGQSRAEMERRLRESYDRLVRDRLGLTQEQAQALNEAVQPFQEERVALQRRESDLRQRLDRQRQGSDNRRVALMPEAQAREVVQEMRALQIAETDLFNREQDRLLQLLTPGQLVSYYLIREQLAEALRRARGGDRSDL
jgi:hypothetical protein